MSDKIPYGIYTEDAICILNSPQGGWYITCPVDWSEFQIGDWEPWRIFGKDFKGRSLEVPFDYLL